MGFFDYISRKLDAKAKPVSKHNEEFAVAPIDVVFNNS